MNKAKQKKERKNNILNLGLNNMDLLVSQGNLTTDHKGEVIQQKKVFHGTLPELITPDLVTTRVLDKEERSPKTNLISLESEDV